ncbi:hypothetical protein CLHUN_34950 [Ruminiclostridium hungatei]|uniref:DUF7847 domain-containing protein n=1 Tax=Ruminiclostridium hungatei TaxID=48256 RepID=A0A1V4SG12_RUMHU|nr:hypothetical protein [Ruminiclostridium hungatei]OPX42673.1 hypothetical protein CLHUN_34950 [Ruminiclostridium hungatei]
MRHLENAFKFTFKNFLLTLPLLISLAIPALITGVGSLGFLAHRGTLIENFRRAMENLTNGGYYNYGDLFAGIDMSSIIVSSIISGLLSFVFMLLVRPATYGLINLHYETGDAKLNDFSRCMSKYIGRFVIYGLLNIAIGIGVAIAFMILIFVGVFVSTIILPLGIILLIGFTLGGIVGTVALYNYMALWFPAVCVEDSDVIDGLKNSFRYVKGNFWPILGITILVNLCGSIAGSILGGIIGLIPVVGSIVAPVITGLAEFILIVFYFEVYRERTGRYAIPEPPKQFDGFQNGGVQ